MITYSIITNLSFALILVNLVKDKKTAKNVVIVIIITDIIYGMYTNVAEMIINICSRGILLPIMCLFLIKTYTVFKTINKYNIKFSFKNLLRVF